ncbi:hypothetical protein H0H87_007953 [Tephrocybe sp. NHM501043]|nr:hypothetical protein H0H87_007953 [Tephrocybe sp. NHM501043]
MHRPPLQSLSYPNPPPSQNLQLVLRQRLKQATPLNRKLRNHFRVAPHPSNLADINHCTDNSGEPGVLRLSFAYINTFRCYIYNLFRTNPYDNSDYSLALLFEHIVASINLQSLCHKCSYFVFKERGAVAGTFTVVSLVIIGAVVVFAFFLRRRSRNGRNPGDNEYYENFAVQPEMGQFASGNATPSSAGRLPASPGLSASELSAHEPMDPQANDNTYLRPDYLPYTSLSPVYERGSDTLISSSPPVFKRPVVGRDSYQPSVDSFYGAP